MSQSTSTRSWLAVCGLTLGSVVMVAIPVWLVQPFAQQSAQGLWWSHSIKRIAPALTTLALAGALVAGWSLWRRAATSRRSQRAAVRVALVLFAVVATGAAWFARQSHFEWMFRPNREPSFVAIVDAAGLDPNEPVIGVTVGNEALAFPITRIGYHHLVNTTIARKPIVRPIERSVTPVWCGIVISTDGP
jgi:uncharacterized protein DUF3179